MELQMYVLYDHFHGMMALTFILQIDRIVFCVFLEKDFNIYSNLMPVYFPPETIVDSD